MVEDLPQGNAKTRRPISVLVLGAVLIFAACLPMLRFLYSANDTPFNASLLMEIVTSVILYLSCALIVFLRWAKLPYWQKGACIGIAVQFVLVLFYGIAWFALMDKGLSGLAAGLSNHSYVILYPLQRIYSRFVISSRNVYGDVGGLWTVVSVTTYAWEKGILFPLFHVIQGGALGAVIGKIVERKRRVPPPPA